VSNLKSRMHFFQLHHPADLTITCDQDGCGRVADYLEVDYEGEHHACAIHTRSRVHVSRLSARKPNRDFALRARSANPISPHSPTHVDNCIGRP
jgi:hypothetical protein